MRLTLIPLWVLLIATMLGIFVAPAEAVVVPAENLPPARVVEQTRAELAEMGCIESTAVDTVIDVPAGKPYRIAARDRLPDQLFFCDPATISQLTPVAGQVRGTWTQVFCSVVGAISPFLGVGCSGTDLVSEVASGKSAAEGVVAPVAEFTISWIVEQLALIAADVGNWVLDKALILITAALGASQFITNPLVVAGWPFIQGIANLGFIIALLFIAFATTLGIDNFGARRMLPRLLIAAILINFSLVISGVIIDFAKLLMAIMANAMGTSISLIDAQIKAGSGILSITAGLLFAPADPVGGVVAGVEITKRLAAGSGPENAGHALASALIIWAMAIGVLWLAIGLLIRYIMLIFLLIVSPLAYLAFAFPNADSFAKQWWQQFFKYVAYGPVALFFLAIASQLSNAENAKKILSDPSGGSLQDFLTMTVMVAMMFAAAIMSKKLGGTFATAAINFSTGKAKNLGRAGLGVATFLPRKAGQEARNLARDPIDTLRGRARDLAKAKLPSWMIPPKRDAQGKLKPGEQSITSALAQKIPQQGKKYDQVTAARALGPITPTNVVDKAISPPMLAQEHVADALLLGKKGTPGRLNRIKEVVDTGSMAQIKSLLRNKAFLRSLDENERNELTIAVQSKHQAVELRVPPGSPPGTAPTPQTIAAPPREVARTAERLVDIFGQIDEEK